MIVLKFLAYLLSRWENRESLKTLGAVRSGKWPKARAERLKEFPRCAVCGKKENLIVHHKKPFHIFPELELEKTNLVVLCESAGMNCHITFGHLGVFKSYNPDIETDLIVWSGKVENKP